MVTAFLINWRFVNFIDVPPSSVKTKLIASANVSTQELAYLFDEDAIVNNMHTEKKKTRRFQATFKRMLDAYFRNRREI